MPFQNTPEDVETGTYSDATVDETDTREVWVDITVETEEGGEEERAFGFILIPKENVPWAKKNQIVQDVASKSRGQGFDAIQYYKEIFNYQVQETSFLPDHKTVKSWLDEGADDRLVREIEDLAPDPLNLGDEDGIKEAVAEIVEQYAEGENGEWNASVEHFYSWLNNQGQVAEGDKGK